jgi:hypothetical protein
MAWYVGRVLAWMGLAGLVLALALQHAAVHEFFFRSEVVEADEDVTLFPTIARFVDDPSSPPSTASSSSSSRSHLKSKLYKKSANSEKIANDMVDPAEGAVGQTEAAADLAANSSLDGIVILLPIADPSTSLMHACLHELQSASVYS